MGIIFIYSCKRDKDEMKADCVLPATVSFNNDIIPIFNSNCSFSGCHSSASHSGGLTLEATVAYSQLLNSGSGYVDTLNPELSLLYSRLISASNPMPPNAKLNDCSKQLILKWIQQKAKNN